MNHCLLSIGTALAALAGPWSLVQSLRRASDRSSQRWIYTIPDAAKLTKVSPSRIRRWLRGYDFRTRKARHHSEPVWSGQLDPLEGKIAFGFCDLMEIR